MIDSFVLFRLARKLPSDEQEEMSHRAGAFEALENQMQEYGYAIELLEHAHDLKNQDLESTDLTPYELEKPFAWMRIAARDAALAIYHFGTALEIFRSRMVEIPTVHQHLDAKASRLAARRFNEAFKGHRDMRNAVAHWTETRTPDQVRKKWLGDEIPIGSIFSWDRRSLTVFRDGKPVSVSLTWENLAILGEVVALAASAYEPVIRALFPEHEAESIFS